MTTEDNSQVLSYGTLCHGSRDFPQSEKIVIEDFVSGSAVFPEGTPPCLSRENVYIAEHGRRSTIEKHEN